MNLGQLELEEDLQAMWKNVKIVAFFVNNSKNVIEVLSNKSHLIISKKNISKKNLKFQKIRNFSLKDL